MDALKRHWGILAAIVVILLIVYPSLALSPTFQTCVHGIPSYTTGEHQREGLPYFLFFQVRLIGCAGPFVDVNANAIIAVFTIILAVSTIALWIATQSTLNHAERSAERELRAYLSVEPLGITRMVGAQTGIGQITVRNVGRVSARDVFIWVQIKTSDDRYETIFDVEPDDKNIRRAIQPEASVPQGSKDDLPIAGNIAKLDPNRCVYVWGVVYYYDGFSKRRRFTRFCHRYAAIAHDQRWERSDSADIFVIDKNIARYHTRGNEAD